MSEGISVDNTSPLWTFSSPCNSSGSAWNFVEDLPGYFNNTESTTNVVGARASFVFQGTAVAYYGTMWAQGANATVYLDELSENISTTLTNGSTLQGIAIWSRSNLNPSTLHALTIEMTGGGTLDIDFVKILTPPPAVIPPAMPTPAPAGFPASSKWSCVSPNSTTPVPNTPANDNGSKTTHKTNRQPMMIGTIVGSICAVLAVVALIFVRRRRRKRLRNRNNQAFPEPDSPIGLKTKHELQESEDYAFTAPKMTGLKVDPWEPTPVFMTTEERAEKRRELSSKLVLDISAVNLNKSHSSSPSPSPSPSKIRKQTVAAIPSIRPLPPVTDSMIVHTGGTGHQYAAVPKILHDWEDDHDADEKDDMMNDAHEMYAAHSWEDDDDNSNEVEDMNTPLIESNPTSPVPSSRLSSSHGGNTSSLNGGGSRAHSRAHRILRSVRSRKSSNGFGGKRSAVSHHRSTGQTSTSTNFSIVATASSTPRTPSSSQSMTHGGKMLTLTGPGSGSVAAVTPPAIRPLPAPGGTTTQYLPSPLSTSPPALSAGGHFEPEPAPSMPTRGPSSWIFGGQRKRNNARRPPMGPRTQTSGSDVSVEAPTGK